MAQVDYFLKIEGIPGESGDDKHKGEIEIESFSWGESNSGTSGHGGGAGAGKVVPQDLNVVKKMDKASPVLMMGCANGTHYKTAVLTARKAGGGQLDYMKITLEDVIVSSYQVGGSAHSNVVPMDQVSFNFSKLEISYKEQKPDGSLGGEIKQKYDYSANKKL
jgi:type VI secretion system secreted protein Hcp